MANNGAKNNSKLVAQVETLKPQFVYKNKTGSPKRMYNVPDAIYLHSVWHEVKHINFSDEKSNASRHVSPDVACVGERVNSSDVSSRFVRVGIDMFVYSVFWDARGNDFDNQNGGVWLRVLSVVHESVAKSNTPLFCIFSNGDSAQAYYYETCENHRRRFGSYILSCRVPEDLKHNRICTVRLSPTTNPEHHLAADFKVEDTEPLPQQRDVTICVAPLHDNVTARKITKFIELASLLGASHFNFYNFRLKSDAVLRLMTLMTSKGRVTLRTWNLPASVDSNIWYHAQSLANLDCLFRGMSTSKLVLYLDLDEILVPYTQPTWRNLLTDLDRSQNTCAYCFDSVFVDPDAQLGSDELVSDPLEHVWRTHNVSQVRRKCMVKPQKVFEVGIHHVSKPINGNLNVTIVTFPRALLHHHRQCMPNFRMDCVNMVRDDVIRVRYAAEVLRRVNRTLSSLEPT